MQTSFPNKSDRQYFEGCVPIKHLTRSIFILSTAHHIITERVNEPRLVQITNRTGVLSYWIENLSCG